MPPSPSSLSGAALVDANGKPLRGRQGRPTAPTKEQTAVAVAGASSWLMNVDNAKALVRLWGSVDDLDINLGWDAKKKMLRDPWVHAAIATLCLGAYARPCEIEPANKALYRDDADQERAHEVAAFVRRAFQFLKTNHRDINLTIYNLRYWAKVIGHQKAELVRTPAPPGIDEGKSYIGRIKAKSRDYSAIAVDRTGNVQGVLGYTGKIGKYTSPTLLGLNTFGALQANTLGGGWELMPRDKWIICTNDADEEDSPLGVSALRPVYAAWRMKRDNQPVWLKYMDNAAMPMTYAVVPEVAPNAQPLDETTGEPDDTADPVGVLEYTAQAIRLARQGGIGVFAHGTVIDALHNTSSGDPFALFEGICNAAITQGILLQTLATGTDNHMARAAGQVHQDVLDLAMRHERRQGSGEITRDIIAPLVYDNFPSEYWHLIPQASFGEVELQDFAAWADAFAKLNREGLLTTNQLPHVWAVLGIPQGDMQEAWLRAQQNSEIFNQLMAPQVDPETGAETPSQLATYIGQELGKAATRKDARKMIGTLGAGVTGP